MTGRPLAGLLLALLAATPVLSQEVPEFRVWEWRHLRNQLDARRAAAPADDAKLPDPAAFDKVVVDALRDVHNRGADLYNTSKDFPGAFRMYEGALRTVRPLLAHRPAAQKMIEEGLAAAEKESSPAMKAFKLHETIEGVRKHLKDGDAGTKSVKPKDPKSPVEIAPDPHEKKGEKPPVEVKKPKDPVGAKAGTLSGRVTFKGQPLPAGEVTVVSLDQAKPRVFSAIVAADGTYTFADPLPPGRYVVIVTGKNIPEKYATTTTSGLVFDVPAGTAAYDIELK